MLKPDLDKLVQFARRQPPFFWLVVGAGLVAFGLFTINGIVGYRYSFYDKFGYAVDAQARGMVVVRVDAGGPAQGKLLAGDVVRSMNGPAGEVPVRWIRTLTFALHRAPDGTAYTLRIERQGVEQTVPLQVQLYRVPDVGEGWRSLSAVLGSLPFAVVALLVGLLRPQDPTARRAFGAMLCFALNYFYSGVVDGSSHLLSGGWLALWVIHLILSGGTLFIALAYNLYYQFPAGAPPGRGWKWLKWLLLGAGTAIWLSGVTRSLWLMAGGPVTANLLVYLRLLRLSNDAYTFLGLTATCVVCVHNFFRVTEPAQRNRIRLMSYGTLVALTPNIVFYLSRLLEPLWPGLMSNAFLRAVNVIGEFSPLLVAAAWGYAILKHRVLGVEVVIRLGVKYLLARNVLRVILALPLLGLLANFVANPNRTLKEILLAQPLNLILLALGALSLQFRVQLGTWLDRRFFREAYQQEQLLLALIEQVKEFNSLAEMARFAGRQVAAALHPARLYIYYLEPGHASLTLGFALDDEPGPPHELAAGNQLTRRLAASGVALARESGRLLDLPGPEKEWLAALKAELIVPLPGPDEKLLGLLICGAKRSEQPYLARDRNLLQAIARQMAVVAENLQLKVRVNQELQIKHNVLAQLDQTLLNLLKECPACGTCYDSALNFCLADGRPLTLTLPVERVIDGKYQLEKLLGKGGMGAVYEATDLRLKRRVALKVITGDLFGRRDALQRFQREARTSAGLNHPNIVAIYDYGKAGAEGAYLVMEFLAGISLREQLHRQGPVPPSVAADWLRQLLEGVKAAHQAGIIHRDLKPDNILLVDAEQGPPLLKVLDFGLAKFRGSISTNLTTPGMLIGTPRYMAPEQLTGREADERSDLFAIGVMTVELITGQRPFSGDNYQELLASITAGAYHLPGQAPETLQLEAVLQRCLAAPREQRYASAEELQLALIPALQACPPLLTVKTPASIAEATLVNGTTT